MADVEIKEEEDLDEWMLEWSQEDAPEVSIKDEPDTEVIDIDIKQEIRTDDASSTSEEEEEIQDDGGNNNVDVVKLAEKSRLATHELKSSSVAKTNKAKENNVASGSFGSKVISGNVGNQCRFECKTCKATFSSCASIRKHFILTLHGQTKNMMEHMSAAVHHKCRQCDEVILCDSFYLWNHVRRHGLTVKQYKEKFSLKDEGIANEKTRELNDLLSSFEISDSLEDMCIFNCPGCERTYRQVNSLLKHFRKTGHEVTKHSHIYILSNHLQKGFAHKCRICGQLKLCEMRSFLKHIQRCHQIKSIKDYCKSTGCSKISKRSEDEKWLDELQSKCNISEEVKSLCKFKCTRCTYNTSSWREQMIHFKKKHKTRIVLKNLKEYLISAELFQCKICFKKVVCDTYVINNHVCGTHKMTIRKYLDHAGK